MRFKKGDFIQYCVPSTKEMMPAIVVKSCGDKMDLFWLRTERIGYGYSQKPVDFKKVGE